MFELGLRPTVALLALSLALAGCGGGEAGPSDEAAEAYAAGREAQARRADRADADAAVASFERAVELDPEYAAAWAGLAQSRMWLEFNLGVPDQLAGAEAAAERAVALAPDAFETHLALGYIDYWGHRDLDAALVHFQAAETVAPDNAEVAGAIGNIHRRKGELTQAIEAYERRVEIDPTLGLALVTLAQTYQAVGRYDDVEAMADRLSDIGDPRAPVFHFWASFHSGDTAMAWSEIPAIQEAQERPGEPGYFAFLQATVRRDVAAADALIQEIGTSDVGLDLRDLMASHISRTGQEEAYADAFDAWVAALEDGLVEAPTDGQARYGQAMRLGDLAFLEALRGNADVSMAHAAAVVELDPMEVDWWGGAGAMGDVSAAHQALGHANPALSILGSLSAEQAGPSAAWMELLPDFDIVRDDERFHAIVEQRRELEQPAS